MCGTPVLRKQIALMGCDAVTAEEWYQKYGHDAYLPREEMFIYLVKLKTNPTHDTTPRMVGKPKASPQAIDRIVCKVRRYLNLAVDEVHWLDRLNRFNHNPHFPYLVTHFTDAMPISSIGGALSDILFNPKYAGCVWKITVAVDNLGNIVWICPVLPGTSADVKIWDKYGPQRTKGCFMEFEVGAHDGAYKGRLHSHVPFIGRKTLTMRQKTYNDVHGYYRAWVEHLFAHLWSWRVVHDIWLGSHQDLHANTRILLHFSQFMLRRQKRYQPYGPWEHIPSSIWTEEEAPEVDEEEEDTFLCQVCGKRDTSECSTCDLYLCRGCMDEHTCDIDVPE